MADITFNIDSQFLVQTEFEWELDSTIYPENFGLLVSADAVWDGTDQRKFKIPNGIDIWDDLDYPPIGGSGLGAIITFWNPVRFNPADNTTYYFPQHVNPSVETSELFTKTTAPKDMIIKCATVNTVAGAGSGELVTFEIGVNGVYTPITTTAVFDATAKEFTNFALNIVVLQGDFLNVRMGPVNWSINPLNLRARFNLYAE